MAFILIISGPYSHAIVLPCIFQAKKGQIYTSWHDIKTLNNSGKQHEEKRSLTRSRLWSSLSSKQHTHRLQHLRSNDTWAEKDIQSPLGQLVSSVELEADLGGVD